jgi:hypothetical protein
MVCGSMLGLAKKSDWWLDHDSFGIGLLLARLLMNQAVNKSVR